LDIQK
jgi:hypothetical protein